MTVSALEKWLRDAAERALSTYVQAFVGLLLAAGTLDIGAVKAALVAAIPAALSVIKSMVATRINEPGSASLAKGV